MPKFRKKPIEIEAIRLTEDNIDFVLAWIEDSTSPPARAWKEFGIKLTTLEGVMYAPFGDWIIKGIAGEFYPCKSDIFDSTYESII